MNNRKYPLSMLIIGVLLELLRKWVVLVLILLVFVIRLLIPAVPIEIPLILLTVLLAYATIKQLIHKNTMLNMNLDSEANEHLDKMFANNKKGYRNVIDEVNEIIEQNRNSND